MKTIIDFINEKQNFLIKGHTKSQNDLKYLAAKMIEVGVCDKPKKDYFSVLTIVIYNSKTGDIHVSPDGINNDYEKLTDEDCKKLIKVVDKEPKLYFKPSKNILNELQEYLKKNYLHTSKYYDMVEPEVYIMIDTLEELYAVLNDLINFARKI